MTEEDWLTHADPASLLAYLRGKVSDRKLRLICVGCCRQSWDVIPPARSRHAVQVAERFVDGLATEEELREAWVKAARSAVQAEPAERDGAYAAAFTAFNGLDSLIPERRWDRYRHSTAIDWVQEVSRLLVERPSDPESQHASRALRIAERFDQCDLIRDIIDNPFHTSALGASWRSGDVLALARPIYDERAFDRLPILADALMEAGCDDRDILDHCRQEGRHFQGCWVVDLLLGQN